MKTIKQAPPVNACACGCGEYLPSHRPRSGWGSTKFIKGHASKLRPLRAQYATKKTHKCSGCGTTKKLEYFFMQKWVSVKGIAVWYPARCRECHKEKYKKVFGDLKKAVYDQYENKCKHCQISDERVLQLDHVGSGGRKEYKLWSHSTIYRKALKFPDLYQLLCANCNWIKKRETPAESGGAPRKYKERE